MTAIERWRIVGLAPPGVQDDQGETGGIELRERAGAASAGDAAGRQRRLRRFAGQADQHEERFVILGVAEHRRRPMPMAAPSEPFTWKSSDWRQLTATLLSPNLYPISAWR